MKSKLRLGSVRIRLRISSQSGLLYGLSLDKGVFQDPICSDQFTVCCDRFTVCCDRFTVCCDQFTVCRDHFTECAFAVK